MEPINDNKQEFESETIEENKNENKIKQEYKKYYNINNFYLKILLENDQIKLSAFNVEKLNEFRYYAHIDYHSSIGDIIEADDMKTLYNKLINLLNEKKCEIKEKEKEDKINLILIKKNLDKEERKEIEMFAEKIDLDDYSKILFHEIKKLKENNEIINQFDEENQKLKKELKDMEDSIKKLKEKPIKEKEIEQIIIEKKKFEVIILEKAEDLNICDKNYGNSIAEALKKVDLSELKELRLYNDNISDISNLNGIKLEKLKFLGLNDNKIADISVLDSIKFESLEELWLSNNIITDITVLGKCKLEYLQKLDLSMNNISDLSVFQDANLGYLKELYLYKNKIEEIKPLENGKFYYLEKLDLSLNQISDISIFSGDKSIFHKLKYLDLSHNRIKEINCLKNIRKSYFQSSPCCVLNSLFLVGNNIDIKNNDEVLKHLEYLNIMVKI